MSSDIKRGAWSDRESELLARRYPDEQTKFIAADLNRTVNSVYVRAKRMGLRKSETFLASPAAGRTDGRKGMGTRFQKGHKPWNRGTSFVAGGRSAETRFKKGNKPQTWVPIGSERLTKDGVRERKVTDHGGYNNKDWQPVHVLEWEAVHGPRPKGHLVVFRDRNTNNISIDNLECISRAENMRRNTIHRYPPHVKDVMRTKGVLTREINKQERAREEQH